MSIQLLNGSLLNNYPVFEGSQVLTSSQLNDMFNYLDQRDRYARSRLIGMGIVCGLHVSVDQNKVKISEGLGITSEGFMIRMPECEMSYQRAYSLPPKTVYEPFGQYADNIYSQDRDGVELFELLTNEPSESVPPYQAIDETFLKDKYLLLFLECFDRDPRSCFGKKCEDLGIERTFNIRKLAVSKAGLDKMLEYIEKEFDPDATAATTPQYGIVGNPFHQPSNLPYLDLKKPLFSPEGAESAGYDAFVQQYVNVLNAESSNIFELLFGEGGNTCETRTSSERRGTFDLSDLCKGVLHLTYEVFEPLLKEVYHHENPLPLTGKLEERKVELSAFLNNTNSSNGDSPRDYKGIQYVYEYFQLLIQAYEEFVNAALQFVAECAPKKYFPQHLMLGKISYEATETTETTETTEATESKEEEEWDSLAESKYRHQFIQPKVLNGQGDLLKKIISLHKRLVLMVEKFDLTKLSGNTVKITPTFNHGSLGERTIPVYFDVTTNGSVNGVRATTLEREWSMDRTLLGRQPVSGGTREPRVLSYEKNGITAPVLPADDKSWVTAPLQYDTSGYAYRVDGILGKSAGPGNGSNTDLTVITGEAGLRDFFHLPFEVMKVDLTDTTANVVVEDHYWEDLQSDYKLIKSGLITEIRNLVSELSRFHQQTEDWGAYRSGGSEVLDFANLDNFLDEIESVRSMILATGGDDISASSLNLIGSLTITLQSLNYIDLLASYKSFASDLRKAYLKLEHAHNILTKEKIEVIPLMFFETWEKVILAGLRSIQDFVGNQSIYQLHNLYYRFRRRFDYLKSEHYSVFSNFIKYHPGITEGKIERGGTHVLVKAANDEVVAAFSLPYRLDPDNIHIPLSATLNSTEDYPPLARGEAVLVERKENEQSSILIETLTNDLDKDPDTILIDTYGSRIQDESGYFSEGRNKIFNVANENKILRFETRGNFFGEDHFEYRVENELPDVGGSNYGDQARVEVLVVPEYKEHIKAVNNLAATSSFYSVVVDVMQNDTIHDGIGLALISDNVRSSNVTTVFGAEVMVVNNQILYTPKYSKEGKDKFTYEILRDDNPDDPNSYKEVSQADVEVIVFASDRFQAELVCEGNDTYFDVMTAGDNPNSNPILDLINIENGSVVEDDTTNGKRIVTNYSTISITGTGDNQQLFYQPNKDFVGQEEFIYQVKKSDNSVRRGRIKIHVIACSETRFERTLKDIRKNFDVLLGNESDLKLYFNNDRGNLYASSSDASNDNSALEFNGSFEVVTVDDQEVIHYIPDAGYFGWDQVGFAVKENGVIKYHTLQILVDSYEEVKVVTTYQDVATAYNVLDATQISDGSLLLFADRSAIYQNDGTLAPSINKSEKGGDISVVTDSNGGLTGTISYTPKLGYLGEDEFNYAVVHNNEVVEYGRFHVVVTDQMVSVAYTTRSNALNILVAPDNSATVDLPAIISPATTPVSARGATLSVVTITENNTDVRYIQYVPGDDLIGLDSFTYQVEISGEKLYRTVYIMVESNERIEVVTTTREVPVTKVLFETGDVVTEFIEDIQFGSVNWNDQKPLEINYEPMDGFVGRDKLQYKATVNGAIEYGTIFFLVTAEEIELAKAICEGNGELFDVLTDAEKENSDITLDFLAENGVASHLSVTGTSGDATDPLQLSYAPDKYFVGTEEFIYEVKESGVTIRRVRLQIHVIACAETRFERALEDTGRDFSVLETGETALKLYTDRSALVTSINTAHGSARIPTENTSVIRYTPATGYHGWDQIGFAVEEGGITKYHTLQVLVDGAEKVSVETTYQDTSADFTLLGADQPVTDYTLIVYSGSKRNIDLSGLSTNPSNPPYLMLTTDQNGTVSVNLDNQNNRINSVSYVPATGYLGEDTFSYAVVHNSEVVEYGRVYVSVTKNEAFTVAHTYREQSVDIKIAESVNAQLTLPATNASDKGATLAQSTVDQGGDADGLYINYDPDAGIIGKDSFDYVLNLAGEIVQGTIYVIVEKNERVEVVSTLKNRSVETNFFDPGMDVVLLDLENGQTQMLPKDLPGGVVKAIYDASGRFENKFEYTPKEDFVGTDQFDFRAKVDGEVQYITVFFLVTCECDDIQISGTVYDELGDKLDGVIVVEGDNEDQTTTTSMGAYMIGAEPGGSLKFSKDATHKEKTVDINYRTQVNVTLERKEVSITGTVVDANDPQLGITDFTVGYIATGGVTQSAGPSANNSYAIDPLIDTDLVFSAPGYVTKTLSTNDATAEGQLNVQLTPNQLTGTVTNSLDEPIAGAEVTPENGESVTTDANGKYTLNKVATGTKVTFGADFYTTADRTVPVEISDPLNVVLEGADLALTVKVVDAQNKHELIGVRIIEVETTSGVTSVAGGVTITVNYLHSLSFDNAPGFDSKTDLEIRNAGISVQQPTLEVELSLAMIQLTGVVSRKGADASSVISGASIQVGGQQQTVSGSNGGYQVGITVWDVVRATVENYRDSETFSILTSGADPVDVSQLGIPANNVVNHDFELITTVAPEVSIATSDGEVVTCAIKEQTLTAQSTTPNVTFEWTYQGNDDGVVINDSTSSSIKVSDPGTYQVEVTDTISGLTGTASVTIREDRNAPDVSVSQQTIPSGGVRLTASSTTSSAEFQWEGYPAGDNPIEVTTSGDYKVTATNPENGCSSDETVTVVIAPPEVTIRTEPENGLITCLASRVNIIAESNAKNPEYKWFVDNGGDYVETGIVEDTLEGVNVESNFMVEVTDTISGLTGTASVAIREDLITPDVSVSQETIPSGGVRLTASSTTSSAEFQWEGYPAGDNPIEVTTSGDYKVTATNPENVCSSDETVTVVIAPPEVTIRTEPENGLITCLASRVNIIAESNAKNPEYKWFVDNGGDYVETGIVEDTLEGVNVESNFMVEVTDTISGLTGTASVAIREDTSLPVFSVSQEAILSGGVRCTATASSTTPNLSFSWEGPQFENGPVADNPVSIDIRGRYNLKVKNSDNGCSTDASISVFELKVVGKDTGAAISGASVNVVNGDDAKLYGQTDSEGVLLVGDTEATNLLIEATGYDSLRFNLRGQDPENILQLEMTPVEPEEAWKVVGEVTGDNADDHRTYVSFSIAAKLYVLSSLGELRSYDPANNTWEVKKGLDDSRLYPVAFTIGEKAYVGLGRATTSTTDQLYNDLWSYDPSEDVWTQVENFPEENSLNGFYFVLNDQLFINFYTRSGNAVNELWTYDPTNNWKQLDAGFSGPRRFSSIGFSANGKGYAGLGLDDDTATFFNDLWQFDFGATEADKWKQVGNLQANPRAASTGFALLDKQGIIAGGADNNGAYQDAWIYDPANDNEWIQLENVPNGTVLFGKAVGGRFFVGVGANFGNVNIQIFEYIGNRISNNS